MSAISTRGLLYDFCFDYTDAHRAELSKITTSDGFVRYVDASLVSKFVAFANKKGFPASEKELKASDSYLRNNLAALLARNTLSDEGFYPIWLQDDDTFNAAIRNISAKKK